MKWHRNYMPAKLGSLLVRNVAALLTFKAISRDLRRLASWLPLTGGSFGIGQFHLGESKYGYRLRCIAEMAGNGFLDVFVQFIEGLALGEDIIADAAGAPVLSIEVSFDLNQYDCLQLPGLYNIRLHRR